MLSLNFGKRRVGTGRMPWIERSGGQKLIKIMPTSIGFGKSKAQEDVFFNFEM